MTTVIILGVGPFGSLQPLLYWKSQELGQICLKKKQAGNFIRNLKDFFLSSYILETVRAIRNLLAYYIKTINKEHKENNPIKIGWNIKTLHLNTDNTLFDNFFHLCNSDHQNKTQNFLEHHQTNIPTQFSSN